MYTNVIKIFNHLEKNVLSFETCPQSAERCRLYTNIALPVVKVTKCILTRDGRREPVKLDT